jgi:hypothetical protein
VATVPMTMTSVTPTMNHANAVAAATTAKAVRQRTHSRKFYGLTNSS